jgi:hypothetical protein
MLHFLQVRLLPDLLTVLASCSGMVFGGVVYSRLLAGGVVDANSPGVCFYLSLVATVLTWIVVYTQKQQHRWDSVDAEASRPRPPSSNDTSITVINPVGNRTFPQRLGPGSSLAQAPPPPRPVNAPLFRSPWQRVSWATVFLKVKTRTLDAWLAQFLAGTQCPRSVVHEGSG